MKRPNIIIIYTDQLKRDFLGCYGADEISTPNIDSLAANGAVFDNFYTCSAVCTPSRGCFMTGNYPYVNGAYKNDITINNNAVGFADFFVNNGYSTGYCGKWHLANTKETLIEDDQHSLEFVNHLGFKDWDYKIEFGHCKSVVEKNGRVVISKDVGNESSYTTDWLFDHADKYINNYNSNDPFLYMLSVPDPHQPFRVRHPYDTMFNPLGLKIPETFYEKELPDWAENDEWGRKHYFPINLFDREGHLRRLKAQYLGEIKCIDDNVGKLIKTLKKKGIYDNTIVIFTSDHGDYMGDHGLVEKNNLYDSVYRIPLIISGVNKSRINSFMTVTDFAKTLISIAGFDSSKFSCNGNDKLHLLEEDKAEGQEEVYIHPSDVPRAGIITRKYELAYVGRGFRGEMFKDHILFDRENDPLQTDNLFNDPSYSKVIEELTDKIIKHHKKLHTPLEAIPKEVWYD